MFERLQGPKKMKSLWIASGSALLLVLLLFAPSVTFAQDELPPDEIPTDEVPTPTPDDATPDATRPPPATKPPPPQTPHPKSAPRSQVPQTRYSRYRTRWYIGFGMGAGSAWFDTDTEDAIGGFVMLLRAGVVILPWLLVGTDLSVWIGFDEFDDSDALAIADTVSLGHFDAVVTVFPIFDQGLYVKGGLGIGSVDANSYIGKDTSENGFNLKLGTGWEFQVGRTFVIGADLTYGFTTTESLEAHNLSLAGTLNWY